MNIKFNGCKHLDFQDNYMAKKQLIQSSGETKVFWMRPVPDASYPSMVQFCQKRGRLNNPESCLCEKQKQCSDYEDFKHDVEVENE